MVEPEKSDRVNSSRNPRLFQPQKEYWNEKIFLNKSKRGFLEIDNNGFAILSEIYIKALPKYTVNLKSIENQKYHIYTP